MSESPRSRLWDRSKRRAWDRAERFASRLAAEPKLREAARDWVETHAARDPAGEATRRWRALLGLPLDELRARLMAADDAGEFLRDTIPPVAPIGAAERARLLRTRP